jgi:antitoxin component of RelBE/YafQ-DinJ toxin-antitoxin module
MEAAILLDTVIIQEAEQVARQLKLPLSTLCSMAIREFTQNHQIGFITEQVNRVYSSQNAKIDDDIMQAQYNLLDEEAW